MNQKLKNKNKYNNKNKKRKIIDKSHLLIKNYRILFNQYNFIIP